ncbi:MULTISPECIES: MCE family protein [unclassified Mycobacterium]|uniref:MCE family protein n=1 Tax=unclassified Mycobacterium TaxID=2642494 RepID=UPI0029C87465|nr:MULTISPECIES: MCE family protein [unclassified Mycobacterium]
MSRKLVLTIVALLFAGLCVAAFALIPRGDDQKLAITAQFEDSIGLYEGNAVSVLGMPVGKVTSIVPKASYVEVKIELDKGVDVPADVQAVTVSTSILTDRHIELTPVYRDGPKLQNGDVLGLTRTRTPVEFDRTLAMVDKLANSLGGDGHGQGPLADLVNIGDQIASGSGPDIKATLDELSQALRLGADNGADTKKTIQAVAANLAELTQAAADNDATIREFGSHVRQLSDILADENLGAGTTGAKVNQILDQAVSLLEKNRDGLKSTLTDVTTLATAANDHRRDIAETLDLLPMLASNIYNVADQNAGAIRAHIDPAKVLLDSQLTKEVCNLAGIKDLGCATGTISDYSPDFGATFWLEGVTGMLKTMAGVP